MAATLTLKGASAVLGVRPKELQSLVQFDVVRPKQVGRATVFDAKAMISAKVALQLKDSLHVATDRLADVTRALEQTKIYGRKSPPKEVVVGCGVSGEAGPVSITIAYRKLSEQVQRDWKKVSRPRSPRDRLKAIGWKKQMRAALATAGKELGELSESDIAAAVSEVRRRISGITVAAG